MSKKDIKELVRQRYGAAISQMVGEKQEGCGCSGSQLVKSCCSSVAPDDIRKASNVISGNLYNEEETEGIPEEALLATFGCGNPTALAALSPGEVVLDLGSGAGLDVLLSAKRVTPGGKAYGLDMTDEMLAVARENQAKAGVKNVEFLKGEIENIPLPDNSVDVIISNCVINLSADKDMVLQEAFRVLKPGGRFAVTDIVLKEELPPEIGDNLLAWVGCIAGALLEDDYLEKLSQAGFVNPTIEPVRIYDLTEDDLDGMLATFSKEDRERYNGIIYSGFVRAEKGN